MTVYFLHDELTMPPSLVDVAKRCANGGVVYGFEVYLLAEYSSRTPSEAAAWWRT